MPQNQYYDDNKIDPERHFKNCTHGYLVTDPFFKFSEAPESVYIFEQLGPEPWGRIGLGIVELIMAIHILVPRTTWPGALLGIGTMLGALFSHITQLGIVVQDVPCLFWPW
nr:DoxX family protein [uncultured Allomuricauda sp.]